MPSNMAMEHEMDLSKIQLCDSRNPTSWRDAQTIDGVSIEEDSSCNPDMPSLIAAAVKGTNNISLETLNETGLAPDAVVKGEDLDGDGDPDVITIRLEIVGLNEGKNSQTTFEIAPGIAPPFWVFAPKSTGMATEGMSAAQLMRMPSPAIRIEQNDEVYIIVENTHYMPHTVHLHGVDHPYVDAEGNGNDGVPITSEMPIQPGESRTYEINPRTTGTMAYHCHVKPDVHVTMGLSGMFIIEENKPNNLLQTLNIGNGKVRYRSVDSRKKYDGEFDLHYQDLDKELGDPMQESDDPRVITQFVDKEYDITEATQDYFMLNGKSFPYTLRESQIIVDPDKQYLLRVLNIGVETMALHTHGHKVLIKALDGVNVPKGTEQHRDVVAIHAAQRVDLILNTTDDGLNSYGEGVWLFHDHEESHITTNGVSPGGQLSSITYRSYLDENGMPKTQGMDLRMYFTEEFYDRTGVTMSGMKGSHMASKIPYFLIIVGITTGFMCMMGFMWWRKKGMQNLSGGYAIPRYLMMVGGIMFLLLITLMCMPQVYAAEMEGIEGIHIMPDGAVMLGTGETLEDAIITSDGNIMLSTGEVVVPILDMRSGGSMESTDTGPVEPAAVERKPATETGGIDRIDMSGNDVSAESSHLGMEGMDGIHIMPNGRVMTGAGLWLSDADVTTDGMIILGSGEQVSPILDMRSGEGIRRTANSMVVNENFDRLPLGCSEIAGEKSITVRAGAEIAKDFPGTMFTYDMHSLEDVEPCTLLTVTFNNMDSVRHQFMVHDLPTDTYPMGMFNIEVTGPGTQTGTFITPPDQGTLLVHCGIPEHEAKGMIAQIKNGGGNGDLPGIPGLTRAVTEKSHSLDTHTQVVWGIISIFLGALLFCLCSILSRRYVITVR
jgi:FtsP/CotA-like multicopper oxidase with cupredoxin domain